MPLLRLILIITLFFPVTSFAESIYLLAMNANTGDLRYTGNDRAKIVTALKRKYGRRLNTIEIPNVSLAKFKAAIRKIKKQAHKGDQVIVYFSGHGSRVLDINKDEKEGDSWDEVLIFAKNERLLDDDFAGYLNPLKQQRITIILDTCHSADMEKSTSKKARYLSKFMPLESSNKAAFEEKQSAIAMIDTPVFHGTLMAASSENESALEDTKMKGGVFTHYFAQALNKGNTLKQSFEIAQKAVKEATKGFQTPEMFEY